MRLSQLDSVRLSSVFCNATFSCIWPTTRGKVSETVPSAAGVCHAMPSRCHKQTRKPEPTIAAAAATCLTAAADSVAVISTSSMVEYRLPKRRNSLLSSDKLGFDFAVCQVSSVRSFIGGSPRRRSKAPFCWTRVDLVLLIGRCPKEERTRTLSTQITIRPLDGSR